MVKLETIGMLKTAKNDPTVIADGETINGYIHVKGSDGKADAPTTGTSEASQTDDLLITLNTITGDNSYNPDAKIASGDFLNSFYLAAWDNQNLIFNEDNITYAEGTDYTDITAGTTVMVAHTDGKLIIADGTTIKSAEHKITFPVIKKVQLDGNAIVVKVTVA